MMRLPCLMREPSCVIQQFRGLSQTFGLSRRLSAWRFRWVQERGKLQERELTATHFTTHKQAKGYV